MNQVIVINSPLLRYKSNLYDEDSLPPHGLGYIATHLENNSVKVELLDCVADYIPLNELIEIASTKNPSFIAINIFTTNYDLVKDFVESLHFTTHIIIGGLATRVLYNDICTWHTQNNIDIVFGDGEWITYDIIINKIKEKPIFQTYKRRVFKVDKNSIYYVTNISSVPLNRKFFRNDPINHQLGFKESTVITSRGCIYNCAFCASAFTQNKDFGIREKEPESIINEITHLTNIYKDLNSIRILDDLFLKNKTSIENAIEMFNRFSLNWRSMVHIMTFKNANIELLRSLRKSGCSELFIGIESGSPNILKRIHKTSDINFIKQVIVNLFQAGISIKTYFIFGFPNETLKDFEMTYSLANSIKKESIKYNVKLRTSVFQYRPYHGTELYQEMKSQNNYGFLKTEHNQHLSNLIGRLQFNFQSGNYSNVDNVTLHHFIQKTLNLNNI